MSVAEHLEPRESFLTGAMRGLKEELGIAGVNLEPLTRVIRTKLEVEDLGIKDYEYQISFRGVSDADVSPQTSEVAEIRLFELNELRVAMFESPKEFTPWFRERANDIGLFD